VGLIFPAAVAAGIVTDYFLHEHFRPKHYPCTALVSVAACIILQALVPDTALRIKGLLFAELMILAGYIDIKTHEIPDILPALIFAVGFIGLSPVKAISGFFAVSLPFYIMARITDGKAVGGGDIKYIAAAGFVLGPFEVMAGALTAITLIGIYYGIKNTIHHFEKKTESCAMAPWLGTGCFIAYILFNGGIT